MTSVQEIIILFSKYPLPGKSKTRLIPALGAEEAANLQRRMTRSALVSINIFRASNPCALEIYYHGGSKESMADWLGNWYIYKEQHPGDLGEKMYQAMSDHLGSYRSILLVGSDCPALKPAILGDGFAALKRNTLVLGPAHDGGYYLIGARGTMAGNTLHELFSNMNWGTSELLEQTLAKAQKLQLSCQLLKKLHDIDTPADLRYLDNYPDP